MIYLIKMKSWKIFALLFKIFLGISASTHWVVTENGRIQSQLDSAFYLRQPFDLVSFLEQEKRLETIESLYAEMLKRNARIESQWTGLESFSVLKDRVLKSDLDCRNIGLQLSEVDLYVNIFDDASEREGINLDELLPEESDIPKETPDSPDCTQFSSLNFSMHMFPHIQVLSQPWNFTKLIDVSADLDSLISVTGRQLVAGLRRNNTSWFLYNLAALHWQVEGDLQKAVQCAKLAMHYVPRMYRDVPLLNLGCLLQRAQLRPEAAILLHAAVDHAPNRPLSHYALATVYAGLGDYNRSVACYDNALRLRPNWVPAQRIRSSVLCHRKLDSALQSLQRSLQDILAQLKDYYDIHKKWSEEQELLAVFQAPIQVKFHSQHHPSLGTYLAHRGMKCSPSLHESDGDQSILTCDSRADIGRLSNNLVIDINLSLQMLLKNVETQAHMINEYIPKQLKEAGMGLLNVLPPISTDTTSPDKEPENLEVFIDEMDPEEPLEMLESTHDASGASLDEEIEEINTKLGNDPGKIINRDYDSIVEGFNQSLRALELGEDGSWLESTTPQLLTSLVAAWLHLGRFSNFTPSRIGAVPVCRSVTSVPQLTVNLLLKTAGGALTPEPRLKSLLFSLFNGRTSSISDLAAHLAFALQEMPPWTIAWIAALYWRLVGNADQTVACLQMAIGSAPPNSRDAPLHNTGILLFRLGYEKEALMLGSLALQEAPHSFWAHYSLFTFYNAMGNKEQAVIFGRASVALEE
ncbi:tetratricopeptide repeat protein 17 isoform X2 [Nilaparvata lugens]|uniref:tetratricopeptide repeat protein 17 isoform X2 n=1 Tax=Nilaparvata lugens TaxID=108931 RepID=UPI00193D322A|nr:tetratricopeptide repeat protein 17 isoform X2 [Nilaparvata lugens]